MEEPGSSVVEAVTTSTCPKPLLSVGDTFGQYVNYKDKPVCISITSVTVIFQISKVTYLVASRTYMSWIMEAVRVYPNQSTF